MHRLATSSHASPRTAVRAVEVTRAQLLALLLLVCVPVPVFSLGALLVPLPEIVERGAAHVLPFVATLEQEPGRTAVEPTTRQRKPAKRSTGVAPRSVAPAAGTSRRSVRAVKTAGEPPEERGHTSSRRPRRMAELASDTSPAASAATATEKAAPESTTAESSTTGVAGASAPSTATHGNGNGSAKRGSEQRAAKDQKDHSNDSNGQAHGHTDRSTELDEERHGNGGRKETP